MLLIWTMNTVKLREHSLSVMCVVTGKMKIKLKKRAQIAVSARNNERTTLTLMASTSADRILLSKLQFWKGNHKRVNFAPPNCRRLCTQNCMAGRLIFLWTIPG
jgi:hypothetical protein